MSNKNSQSTNGNIEIKQAFLSSAIADISSYIQLIDTKVSIIMAAIVAILAGAASCYEFITDNLDDIVPCSWKGIGIVFFTSVEVLSIIFIFVFGILTIRSHSSKVNYKSKWFLVKSTKEYSFDEFKKDVLVMSDEDVIENMSAELYKLNDINRQKSLTYKYALVSFSASLIMMAILILLVFIL